MANRGIVALVVVGIVAATVLFGPSMIGNTGAGFKLHLPLQLVAIDELAGGTDATTTQIKIYDANLVYLETVVISTAAGTDSAIKYDSGEVLYGWIDDLTDTSLCHIYQKIVVPFHSSDSDTRHYITLKTVDTDASWDVRLDLSNETNLADSSSYDTSQSGTAPTFVFKIITPTNDKGFKSSWNFVEGCDNTIYYVMKLSGTGATRVLFDTNRAIKHYYDGSFHWYAVPINDDSISKDLLADGTYDPIGYFTLPLKMDLTAVTSGDSVTFAHGLYYYADWNYFVEKGTWGPDMASVTESITIVP